jgi:hypothetical protein
MAEVLVKPERIERFLEALANPPLAAGRDQFEGYVKRFPEFFPAGIQQNMFPVERVQTFTMRLREIWTEQDIRARQWKIFVLRLSYRTSIEPDSAGDPYRVPSMTPFEQAMIYFDRNHDRFRYCKNPEGCTVTPHYIAKTRKPTKYCSQECGDPARREAKLRWWDQNKKGDKHAKK